MPAAPAVESSDDIFSCIEKHCYGVLPSGNIYVQKSAKSPSSQAPLPDQLFSQVLQYCDGRTLAQVVQVCRDWYVAGHEPELWRDLVLRESPVVDAFQHCWKDTFVMRRVGKVQHPHVPMAIPGVYSEYYYRTHFCRSFSIPPSWYNIEGGTIERVKTPLTTAEFLTRYEQTNTPVVLAGACRTWKAFEKWQTVDYLRNVTPNQTFRATSGAAPLSASFTLSAYHDYCQSPLLEEAPLYLFDRTALLQGPLHDDFYQHVQDSCPFWATPQHDLLEYLGSSRRPDHTWLICGPQRSGSSFHMDPNATHAYNATIVGRKRWIFSPPSITPPGVYPSDDGENVVMPISIGEWLLDYYCHLDRKHVLECTVEPGDIVFVPHGWWHAVINLDPINVALTHNYVSQSNLPTVLKFLSEKQNQISGCRDRLECVPPECLREELERALVKHGLEHVLNEAKEVASRGWPCRAWSDGSPQKEKQQGQNDRRQSKCKKKRQRDAVLPSCDSTISDTTVKRQKTSIMAKAKPTTTFQFSFL